MSTLRMCARKINSSFYGNLGEWYTSSTGMYRMRQNVSYVSIPQVNGEAIYSTIPWKVQNDTAASQTWYTASKVIAIATSIIVWLQYNGYHTVPPFTHRMASQFMQ